MENARRGTRPRKFNTAEKAGERRYEKRRDDDSYKGKRRSTSGETEENRGFQKERYSHRTDSDQSNNSFENRKPRSSRRFSENDDSKRDYRKPRTSSFKDDNEKREYKPRTSKRYSDTEDNKRDFRKPGSSGFGERKRSNRDDDSRREDRPKRYGDSSERRRESSGYEKRSRDTKERRFNDKVRDERRESDRSRYYDREDRNERRTSGYRSERFEKRDESGEIRLNRYIAQSGICSRREADEMIALGEVKVNGKIVTELGTKVTKNDIVIVNEELIKNEKLVYLVLNKPKGFITSLDDPDGRETVMELVKRACKERIYPVGRLDRNTTGILLFTNDGDLAKKLTHPSHQIRKVYHIVLDKPLTGNDMQQITDGVLLDDGLAKADVIAYVGTGNDKKEIGVELHSGKNRIVRRIFEHLGYTVVKLDRVSFAGITKKDIPRGRWRFLEDREISFLKMV